MDHFERLLDAEATDVERALLESAADDAPSARARKRTLAAMGVGAGVVVSATHAAHAATKLAATGSVTSAAKGIGSVSGVLVLKWLGTGALVGSVVAASVATVTTPGLLFSKRRAPVETTTPHTAAVSSPSRVGSRGAGQPIVTPAAPGEPEVARAAASPTPFRGERFASPTTQGESALAVAAPPSVAANVPAPAGTNVSAEVASLDKARSALALGDPHAALERLAAHDAAFPRGTLEPEAVVLRVRALIALGQHAEGARVAERFIARHPESAQGGRLRALVGDR